MKKITIFVASLIIVITGNAKPLSVGVEYRCTTAAIHRIVGDKAEEIKVPSNAKPIYITEKNNTLLAKYMDPGSPEVSDNNAMLVKTEVADEKGRKFDVAIYKKMRKDGENQIRIFKEINGKSTQITMMTLSRYTEMPAALRMIYFCE
jgi:hypothetical protein